MLRNKKPIKIKKIFIIGMDLFPYDCLVVINKTPEQAQKVLTKYGKPLGDDQMEIMRKKRDGSALYLFHDVYNTSVIYIKSTGVSETITLFDHEKMHFMHHVFGRAGISLSDATEEVYAYTSEYLMKQFLSKY